MRVSVGAPLCGYFRPEARRLRPPVFPPASPLDYTSLVAISHAPCAVHASELSVASCAACMRSMCDGCARFVVDARLLCAECGEKRQRLRRPRWLLVAAFLVNVAAVVAGYMLLHPSARGVVTRTDVIALALGTALIAVRLGMPPVGRRFRIALRAKGEPLPAGSNVLARPYRSAPARRLSLERLRGASVSGARVAVGAGIALGLSASMLPFALGLPAWIEFQVVLFSWWLTGVIALSVLLYRGRRITDDRSFSLDDMQFPPRIDTLGPIGCASILEWSGIGIAIVLALVLSQLIVLAVAFAVYTAAVFAFARTLNDDHGCEHNWPRALAWGTLWSTLHIAPVATLVWLLHVIARLRGVL